jgi:Flp pilus assembly protein protease CpaA
MAAMLLIFGLIESKIYISSIILSLFVLLFFIVIMLINRQIILGGGDIKYMMIVALYLGIQPFALFLIITGLLQTFALVYVQKVKKRRIAPMVPMMFLSTIIVEILVYINIYPFRF